MRPGFNWYGRRTTNDLGTGTAAQDTTWLEELRNVGESMRLASAGGWTEREYGSFDVGAAYRGIWVIMEHTNGAECCLSCGMDPDAGNLLSGGGDRSFHIAFKRSGSAGSFATLSASVNPYSTATYCSDADAFGFVRMDCADTLWYGRRWQFGFICDKDSAWTAVVAISYDQLGFQSINDMCLFADDGGTSPNFISVNPGDVYKAYFLFHGAWLKRTGTPTAMCAYDSSGNQVTTNWSFSINDNLTWKNDLWRTGYNLIRIELLNTTIGRKGVFDDKSICTIRADANIPCVFAPPGQTNYQLLCMGQESGGGTGSCQAAVPYPYEFPRVF